MAQVSVVQSQSPLRQAPATPPVAPLELVQTPACGLCGEPLTTGKAFDMISPFKAHPVSVCRRCHRAALGEGYRPRA